MDKEGVKTARSLSKSADEDWNPFLACSEETNLWKRLFHALTSRGFMGMVQELKKNRDEAPQWLTFLGNGVDSISGFCGSLYGKAFPHLNLSREEMITAFSSISHWPSSPIRAFGWHPHISKFAIAWQDDHIKVYTLKSNIVPLLKHRQQQAVTCLAWRPLSASVLAVGCNTGIFIWTVDPTSPVTRLGSSSVRHLSQPCHNPVTSISWSPNGQLLVSGSPADSTMMVWDVNMETATPLYRAGGGISLTCWSPDERKLFVATPGSMFRIWEAQTWTCEKWSNLAGRCKSACWSPDGSIILFAVAEEPALYSLKFISHFAGDTDVHGSAIGAQMAVKAANLSPHCFNNGDDSVTVGGVVKSMAWDPLGERLAVIFEDDDGKAQEIVAIFKTRLKPTFEVIPSGFVRGPPDSFPELVAFQQNFSKGALLTVGWSDGSITFVPLLFTSSKDTHPVSHHAQNGVFTNGTRIN
ncbi:aladin-like isoform X2 [Actinia tenebrosa]|nr:aladin-like isoform X2 [Actinia tenebrosa]